MKVRGPAAALLLAAATAFADAPPWLAEAIRLGSTPTKLEAYAVPGLAVTYTTPFLRVARTANAAVRAGKTFGVTDVPVNAYAPELRLLIGVRAVTAAGKVTATASPKSVRLIVGAGEIKATRMDPGTAKQTMTVQGGSPVEVTGGILKAVFEIKGTPPRGAELEIHYESPAGAPKETIVERVPLDFTKTRW
jgi:hypothetical protein